MKKEEAIKRLYRLGIFTLVTSFLIVSLSGYHQLVDKKITKEEERMIEPLQPELRTDSLPAIRQRKEYSVEEVSEKLREPTPTPTPDVESADEDSEAISEQEIESPGSAELEEVEE